MVYQGPECDVGRRSYLLYRYIQFPPSSKFLPEVLHSNNKTPCPHKNENMACLPPSPGAFQCKRPAQKQNKRETPSKKERKLKKGLEENVLEKLISTRGSHH